MRFPLERPLFSLSVSDKTEALHAAHACGAVSGTFWLLASGQRNLDGPEQKKKEEGSDLDGRAARDGVRVRVRVLLPGIESGEAGIASLLLLLCGVRFIGQLNMQIELSVLSTRRMRRRRRR